MKPKIVVDLFPPLSEKLISFLKSLSPKDWERSTISPKWKVRDIAAHLLDGNFRRIATIRDQHFGSVNSIDSYQNLVDYLNQLNADWIKATQRLSPAIILELLEQTDPEIYRIFQSLDPQDKALFPVAWAGEEESSVWFDIAREYTEKWIHQQQIRDAFDDWTLLDRELGKPCLDILTRALPHTYRNVKASENTLVELSITGDAGGLWFIKMGTTGWEFVTKDPVDIPASRIEMSDDTAWKLFSKAIKDKDQARKMVEINGDRELGEPILDMISVMA